MPGQYVVNFTDPSTVPITIQPRGTDTTTTLRMTGYLSPLYGEMFWENFLHLLENFSNTTPPTNPVRGQFWMDTSTTPVTAYVYDPVATSTTPHDGWHLIDTSGLVRSTTPPTDTRALWHDLTDKVLKFWVDGAWKAITPISVSSAPASPYRGQIWHDVSGGEVKFWSGGDQWRRLLIPASDSLAMSDRYTGLVWFDTAANVMRFHRTETTAWAVTNLYSATPDAVGYNGQLWLDTSASPATPRIYDNRYTNTQLDISRQNWHTIRRAVEVGTTPPGDVTQMWYNPTSPASLSYWTGTEWTNILWCANMATACDYNKLVDQINPLLVKSGKTTIPPATDAISPELWTQLFQSMVSLATYWNVRYPTINQLVPPTAVTHCNDPVCGWHVILRRFESFLCALHYASDSETINPECEDVSTPAMGTYIRNTAWDGITVITTVTFRSATELETFFAGGGKLRLQVGLTNHPVPASLGTIAWKFALSQLQQIEITSNQTTTATTTYPTGVKQLTSTETPVVYQPVSRVGGNCVIALKREGGIVAIKTTLLDTTSDGSISGMVTVACSSVGVGAPCRITPLAHPTIVSLGVVQVQQHTTVGGYVGSSLYTIATE